MNTKKEIVDKCYFILWEDQSSTVFDKEWEVVPKINTTIDQICRCNITNIITGEKIRWGILDFLYEEKTLFIPKVKQTMVAITPSSKTIKLDSVDWLPPQWCLEINGNVITYNGLDTSNNEVLKVSGIDWPHEASSSVNFAYMFPESMIKPSDFYDIEFEQMLKFVDFREHRTYDRCYTIKPYKSRKVAIFFNINSPIAISYTKKLEPMVSDNDECWLPDDYGVNIVPYLVIWGLLIDTSEWNKGRDLLNQWYSNLEDMYSYYATPTKKFRKKIKTAPLVSNLR